MNAASSPPAGDSGPAPAPRKAPARGPAGKAGKTPARTSPRRRSREFARQGLYQWLLSGEDAGVVDAHMREQDGFARSDTAHFDALLHGCIAEASALDEVIARHADRRTTQLSPVEHAALMIGAYELRHCIDVPYRVVINEAVELAKAFGSDNSSKFINGVLGTAYRNLQEKEPKK